MLAASNWVPILTSEAGLTLTSINWQEANVSTAVYYLDALLLKPGLALLKEIADFSLYINWSKQIIINATRLKANKEGIITLVSPFDGSKLRLDYEQLINLILQIKPQQVILPVGILNNYPHIWTNWNPNIIPYLSPQDLEIGPLPSMYGVYFDEIKTVETHQSHYKHLSKYVQGMFNLESIKKLSALGIDYIESDEPSQMGLEGLVYDEEGIIDLKNELFAFDFKLISPHCGCPTCATKLTRAYLHHLHLHTPLLCQRFLIQHNAFAIRHLLNKD